ncbi:MAG TPA: glutathione S-transferase N-terminal domain-containing protein [Asticcacaulis sp.]|nr:glutathione S-transferase N-terminal domain-containing protein [Asticcacaulis sp.]
MRILGRTSSLNVRKVLWTCDELGLAYGREWTSGVPGDDPDFRKLNPNGLIPVIIDDNGVLWESNTICRYLIGLAGREELLPAAPAPRAQVERWMDWQATELNAAWRPAFLALARRDPRFQDQVTIAASIDRWNAVMAILNAQLSTTDAYVAGPSFTLADIAIGLSVHRWLYTPMQRPELRAVAAYYDRLRQRPAFAPYALPDVP